MSLVINEVLERKDHSAYARGNHALGIGIVDNLLIKLIPVGIRLTGQTNFLRKRGWFHYKLNSVIISQVGCAVIF
ncbi:hypothetical protein D3C75_1089920 [compost metagenome]